MTPEDVVVIPYLINNFDSMELNPKENDNKGNRAIEIRKRINGVSVIATIERGENKEFLVTSYQFVKSDALDASKETPGLNVRNDSDIANVKKDIENIKETAKNSSKVVDENGEPMEVYHQTNSTIHRNIETGEIWDELDWRAKQEWEERDDWEEYWVEEDFYTFDNKNHGRRSVEMPAFFFSPTYDEYHEYGKRTIPAFLNIRNPKKNPTITDAGVTNTAGEDAMKMLIEEGYDGFIREYDGVVKEINAFFSNQIKSATDNIGTYDGENGDIRFSKKFNRDNIAEVVYRNRMIIDYNRYVFENRPRGILKPHYGYIDEDRLEEYKAFYQDIKNKAEDLKSYLKEVIMTDATSGAKSFLNEYIAKIDREVDAYRRLSENDNSVLNEYLRFSRKRGSLTKETVEKGFGGIWIADKQEYTKFVSAINNYVFEEDGEGIAYTDNYFYAYYWNIDGEPIPFASVHLNAEDSQDVVNQITQDIKDGRKKGIRDFVDRANELAWNIQSKNDVISGNDKSQSNTRRTNSLDSDIQRKGRYFDRPDLYVKTQRTDRGDRQTEAGYSRGRERGDIDDTRFSRKMGEAKAQLADMKYGEAVRMDALAQAKAMFLQGEPMEDIFAQTGWKQQNMFGKPTWIYTEPDLSAREKLDRFLKADRNTEIEMLTLGNKKLSELRAMLGNTINMKTFKSKLQEIGKSEEEVREDLADFVL